jgi:hypothetical protein
MQMLQQKDQVAILYANDYAARHVYMNRTHPEPITPSWYGDSVRHYERIHRAQATWAMATTGHPVGRNMTRGQSFRALVSFRSFGLLVIVQPLILIGSRNASASRIPSHRCEAIRVSGQNFRPHRTNRPFRAESPVVILMVALLRHFLKSLDNSTFSRGEQNAVRHSCELDTFVRQCSSIFTINAASFFSSSASRARESACGS